MVVFNACWPSFSKTFKHMFKSIDSHIEVELMLNYLAELGLYLLGQQNYSNHMAGDTRYTLEIMTSRTSKIQLELSMKIHELYLIMLLFTQNKSKESSTGITIWLNYWKKLHSYQLKADAF